MLKRIKQSSHPTDRNQLGHYLVEISTQESDKITPPTKAQISMLMAQLGQKGGRIGGKRRLQTMTGRQRSAIARRAAQARWEKP